MEVELHRMHQESGAERTGPHIVAVPKVSSVPEAVRALRAERLLSLDAFRGITIAAMLLVNNPGSWSHVYAPLEHAAWNGWTPTDLIFPFFLFIVGVAIAFSLVPRRGRGDSWPQLLGKITRRAAIIFALGIILNGFPSFDWSVLRIPGVLQRIAVCYFFAALLALALGVRGQVVITIVLLLGYWAVMLLVPAPGHAASGLGPSSNLAARIDAWLLHGHLLHSHWDPEGILSTLPAIATTLSGVLTGHWLRSPRSPLERVAGLFVAGNAGLLIGVIMDAWFPINKNLWTSSYVVFSSGMALNVLAICYWLIDVKGYQRWAKPFVIYGTNPIVAYMLSSLMAKVMLLWPVHAGGEHIHLRRYVFDTFFLSWGSPINASLLYAIAYVLFWLGIMAILYRKRIFIKI
jgi:predicted acyltransferase